MYPPFHRQHSIIAVRQNYSRRMNPPAQVWWPIVSSFRETKCRPSPVRGCLAPERRLRSVLLQIFYSVRSERMLIEQLQYNPLFRWFVVMEMGVESRGVQQESGAFF